MITHFLEVWLILAIVFAVGCVGGALAYEFVAQSGLAHDQRRAARTVGLAIDGVRRRLGLDPGWREYRVVPAEAFGEEPFAAGPSAPAAVRPDPVETAEAPREQPTAPVTEPVPDEVEAGGDAAADAMRPMSLGAPRRGVPDDLQRIRGIGKKNERLLNQLGVFHFGQIAAWTPAEVAWIGQHMAFPERIVHDDWVGQAIVLATGSGADDLHADERRRVFREALLDSSEEAVEDSDEDDADAVDTYEDDDMIVDPVADEPPTDPYPDPEADERDLPPEPSDEPDDSPR